LPTLSKIKKIERLKLDALGARGESSINIIVNVFKGYLAEPDKKSIFKGNIRRTNAKWDNI